MVGINRAKGSAFADLDNFGYISLGDIGKGDGVTDNTAVLVAALATGIPVAIPVGTFVVGSFTVPANGFIFGLAGGKSILKIKDLNNAIGISMSTGAIIRNFAVDGNKVNQVGTGFHTIQINGVNSCGIEEITVSNPKGDGINITGAIVGALVRQCTVTGYTENGIRVVQGTDISINNCNTLNSDAVASGDGIAISSGGNAISRVQIDSPVSRANIGRGISILGNGSKNVTSVSVVNPRVSGNTSNGIHLINVDGAVVIGGFSNSNGIDGLRVEGDVQNCRFTNVMTRDNISFGAREVIAGSTPNFNGFIYGLATGNGNNAITKVGASSYVV